jgi:hypothetical protein
VFPRFQIRANLTPNYSKSEKLGAFQLFDVESYR